MAHISSGRLGAKPGEENYVSGDLLEAATRGNKTAISTLCGLIAQHVRAMTKLCGRELDVTLVDLVEALVRIERGESPDEAFAWAKVMGRPSGELTLRRKQSAAWAADALVDVATKAVAGNDDLTSVLVAALRAIENGSSPNKAFNWELPGKKGRRQASNAARDWDIKMSVIDEMKGGQTWAEACHAVSSDGKGEFLVSEELVKKLCVGLNKGSELEFPEDVYPLPKTPYRART